MTDTVLDRRSKEFQISNKDGKAIAAVIDHIYTDKKGSAVRETMANAFDAHAVAGTDKPFDVALPVEGDMTFYVRDYGLSMTDDEIFERYTMLFDSTKEDDDDQVGQWGLGSKAPFAVTSEYFIECYQNGTLRGYAARRDEDGVPYLVSLMTVPTDEPDGTKVWWKVTSLHGYAAALEKALRGYDPGAVQVVRGVVRTPTVYAEGVAEGDGWRIVESTDWSTHRAVFVRMGCIAYPTSRIADFLAADRFIVIDVPIGSFDVTTSREAIASSDRNSDLLKAYLSQVQSEVIDHFQEQVEAAPTRAKAVWKIDELAKSLSPSLSAQWMTWRGQAVSSKFSLPQDIKLTYVQNGRRNQDPPTTLGTTAELFKKKRLVINETDRKTKFLPARLRYDHAVNDVKAALMITDPQPGDIDKLEEALGVEFDVLNAWEMPHDTVSTGGGRRNSGAPRKGIYMSNGSALSEMPEDCLAIKIDNINDNHLIEVPGMGAYSVHNIETMMRDLGITRPLVLCSKRAHRHVTPDMAPGQVIVDELHRQQADLEQALLHETILTIVPSWMWGLIDVEACDEAVSGPRNLILRGWLYNNITPQVDNVRDKVEEARARFPLGDFLNARAPKELQHYINVVLLAEQASGVRLDKA